MGLTQNSQYFSDVIADVGLLSLLDSIQKFVSLELIIEESFLRHDHETVVIDLAVDHNFAEMLIILCFDLFKLLFELLDGFLV